MAAIRPYPLSYNEAWQVVSMSELKGVRYQMCPGFLVHFIVKQGARGAHGYIFYMLPMPTSYILC